MIRTGLLRFGKELGLSSDNEVICGIYDGYFVTFSQNEICTSLIVDVYFEAGKPIKKERLRSYITSSATYYGISHVDIKNTLICIDFGRRSTIGMFRDYFFSLLNELKLNDVAGADTCTNCGKPVDKINVVFVGGNYHVCCSDCASRLSSSSEDAAVDYRSSSDHGSRIGFIGALLGTLIGAVVWMALDYFGCFPAFAAVIMAILAVTGHTLFAGVVSSRRAVWSIIYSLIFIPVTQFLALCYGVLRQWKSDGYIFEIKEAAVSTFEFLKTDENALCAYLLAVGCGVLIAVLTSLLFVKKKQKKRDEFIIDGKGSDDDFDTPVSEPVSVVRPVDDANTTVSDRIVNDISQQVIDEAFESYDAAKVFDTKEENNI